MIVFPIADLQCAPNKLGMRCIQIEAIFRQVKDAVTDEWVEVTSRAGRLEGYFQGVIDIWASEEEQHKYQYWHKLTLYSAG